MGVLWLVLLAGAAICSQVQAFYWSRTLTLDLDGMDNGFERHKRQSGAGEDFCRVPVPLKDGMYRAHPRRCPHNTNSSGCRLDPHTPVPVGWTLRYACGPGYRLNTTRRASMCLHREGGGKWLPSLPACLETSYHSNLLPHKNVCGKPSRHLRTKRQSDLGQNSFRGAWPWLAILGHYRTGNPRDGINWFCAGTLITTKHILTAANCVALYRRRPNIIARLDDLNLNDAVTDGATPINIEVDRKDIIVHPGFNERSVFAHNIAIVKLKSGVPVTDFVRPICLPTPDFRERGFPDVPAQMATWGQADEDSRRKRRGDPVLRDVEAIIMDHETCNLNYEHYQSSDTPIIITDKIICASVESTKSCQGDTGSPLMLEYRGVYILLGIVATKRICYSDFFPRVFTRISEYMDWIVSNLNH